MYRTMPAYKGRMLSEIVLLILCVATGAYVLTFGGPYFAQLAYAKLATNASASSVQQRVPALPHWQKPVLIRLPVLPVHDYTIPPVTNGVVPVIRKIPTTEKVAFLTIDDGIVTNPSDAQLMQASGAKATFFLVYRFINTDSAFFEDLATHTGSDIENHTYDHYLLTNLTYNQQKEDICKNADIFTGWFGKRPVLLRPSGGAYNDTTLHAAADCGMKALIMWDASINNGVIKYQDSGKMQPGDIVLMHFRSTFSEDLNAFVQAAQSSGLQPALLVDWLS